MLDYLIYGYLVFELACPLAPKHFEFEMAGICMDCLHLNGIRAYGYTGVFPEEQTLGQWFEVDLTLWLDLAKAGATDRLEDTYDYSKSILAVQELIHHNRSQLIESVAEAIAQLILATPHIHQVRVRLTKAHPPVPGFSGHVAVEIVRPT